ncbi:MAG: hypothetical protein Q7S55_03715 [Nanoarchaeota archaeon]|nr:hypothetical protein [Nanoarchaeota archaeon]
MSKKYDFTNLKDFFDKVNSIGFFERLFFWSNIVTLRHDAYAEFKNVDKQLEAVNDELNKANSKIEKLDTSMEHFKETKANLEAEKNSLEQKKEDLTTQVKELAKEVSGFKKLETKNQEDQKEIMDKYTNLVKLAEDRIRDDRKKREDEIEERFTRMKETWKEHQKNVQEIVKRVCSRHNIEYVDKVPFKGDPDNTLNICDEYIIFDAKSPSGEDLSNFQNYIKSQSESAKKYAKEKSVKKEIFLVIPANTVEVITQTYYNLVDYSVHVITPNAIEPIILSLKKIEEYEFAEQLSPEDRAQICRVIGKFAHAAKRRIQVDNYFAQESIDILSKCYDLPKDILEGSLDAEKSGMLNPTQERRAKQISIEDLKKDNKRIKKEAEAKDIDTKADLNVIETVPLYKKED